MRLPILALGLAISAGGTVVKVYDHGPIELERVQQGKTLAPVLMMFKTESSKQDQEIVVRDQGGARFILKVSGAIETSKGLLFYLPAQRDYALFSLNGFPLGFDLPMFRVQRGVLNEIPYFEIKDTGVGFRAEASLDEQTERRLMMRKRFGFNGKIIPVKAF